MVYMNDLVTPHACKIVLFADDVKIWRRINSAEDCTLLQKDLDALYDWALSNKLTFNVDKCKMIQLGKPVEHSYHLGPQNLSWTTSEKDLGVWISSSLKSSVHPLVVYYGYLEKVVWAFDTIYLAHGLKHVHTICNGIRDLCLGTLASQGHRPT